MRTFLFSLALVIFFFLPAACLDNVVKVGTTVVGTTDDVTVSDTTVATDTSIIDTMMITDYPTVSIVNDMSPVVEGESSVLSQVWVQVASGGRVISSFLLWSPGSEAFFTSPTSKPLQVTLFGAHRPQQNLVGVGEIFVDDEILPQPPDLLTGVNSGRLNFACWRDSFGQVVSLEDLFYMSCRLPRPELGELNFSCTELLQKEPFVREAFSFPVSAVNVLSADAEYETSPSPGTMTYRVMPACGRVDFWAQVPGGSYYDCQGVTDQN